MSRIVVTDSADGLGGLAAELSEAEPLDALMAAVARLRPEVLSNAVDPGWVPTRMGGAGTARSTTRRSRTTS